MRRITKKPSKSEEKQITDSFVKLENKVFYHLKWHENGAKRCNKFSALHRPHPRLSKKGGDYMRLILDIDSDDLRQDVSDEAWAADVLRIAGGLLAQGVDVGNVLEWVMRAPEGQKLGFL